MKTAIPSVYPAEGSFEFSSIHIDLSCVTPDARIHYTLDGTTPTMDSPVYRREQGLLALTCRSENMRTFAVHAFAEADGMKPSRTVEFEYRLLSRAKGTYRHLMLREPSATASGIIRLADYNAEQSVWRVRLINGLSICSL